MHRLALSLGRTVAEIRMTMSAVELDAWAMYWLEEPWGCVRDNIHAGLIAATFANAFRGKNSKVIKASDFMIVGESDREARAERGKATFIKALRIASKRAH